MNSIRQRAMNHEVLSGTWLIMGSSLSAEIAGQAGFDWVSLDQEHGMGGFDNLLHELQALGRTPARRAECLAGALAVARAIKGEPLVNVVNGVSR